MRYRNEVGGQSKTPNKPPDTAPVFRVLLQRYWLTMRGGGGRAQPAWPLMRRYRTSRR